MAELLNLGGVWMVEILLSPELKLPTVLPLTLLLPALVQWLVLHCTHRRLRALRWLTLLPAGFPLLSCLWLAFQLHPWPIADQEGLRFFTALLLSLGLGVLFFLSLLLTVLYLTGWGLGWGLNALAHSVRQKEEKP